MKLIAVDPGLTVSGIALFNVGENKRLQLSDWWALTGDGTSWFEKADSVWDELEGIILATHDSFAIAIEEPIYSWGRKNPKAFSKTTSFMTTIIVRAINHGDCKWVRIVNPKTMKMIFAGDGKADKTDIVNRVLERNKGKFGEESTSIVWPTRRPHREAVADAVGIGYTAWQHRLRGQLPGVELLYSYK